jgi:hypothetical protein
VNYRHLRRDVEFLREQRHHDVRRVGLGGVDDGVYPVATRFFERVHRRRVHVQYEAIVVPRDLGGNRLVVLDDDHVVALLGGEFEELRTDVARADDDDIHSPFRKEESNKNYDKESTTLSILTTNSEPWHRIPEAVPTLRTLRHRISLRTSRNASPDSTSPNYAP